MHYEIVELPARTIVGPTVRTSNNSPEETTVIGQLWQRFMGEGLDRTISEVRVVPYGCFALYYGYDMSDMSYELLVGCETPADAPEDHRRRPLREDRHPRRRLRDQRPESLGGDLGRRGAGGAARVHRGLRGVPARRGHVLRRHRRVRGPAITPAPNARPRRATGCCLTGPRAPWFHGT